MATTTIVRPAGPEDADFLGWTILEAGRAHLPRGWYDIALGLPEAECLAALARLVLARTPAFWNYANFLVADVDGRAGAALCCFGSKSGWGQADAAMAEAMAPLGWGPAELAALWARGAYVFTCAPTTPGDVWVIENVATLPALRGRGLAGRLIEAALDKGRAAGFDVAQISFVIGNAAAERAYLRAGFEPDEEHRHPDFEASAGAPGIRRFRRTL